MDVEEFLKIAGFGLALVTASRRSWAPVFDTLAACRF